MKRMQKVLLALAVLATFGASNALAVTFSVSANARQVRGPGITEGISELLLSVSSVLPSGTILGGSSIVITFDGELSNDNDLLLGAGNNVICNPLANCPSTITTEDNQLILSFNDGNPLTCAGPGVDLICGTLDDTDPTDSVTFANGNTINIVALRMDVSEITATAVNASLTGQSANPGTNPITFGPQSLRVGTRVDPPITVDFGDQGDLGLDFDRIPVPILTCDPGNIDDDEVVVFLQIDEEAPAMFASAVQERAVGETPDDINDGTSLVFTFKGVPEGFIIRPLRVRNDKNGVSTVTFSGDFGEDGEQESDDPDGEDLEFEFEVTGSNTSAIEKVVFFFAVGTADGDPIPTGGATGSLNVEVSMGPLGGGDDDFIRFADNVEFDDTVAVFADCATFLLFSWNAFLEDGSYNTGYAVNNSGAAISDVVEAAGETGDVTLYFYPTDGSPAPDPIVIAEDLAPGETATYALSGLGQEFTGYVIAHCEFRYCHGINYLSNFQPDGFAQGYQAVTILSPRPIGGDGGGSGH